MTRGGGPPMRPDGPVEKPRSFGPSVKRLVRLLLGHRWSMLTILGSTLVGVALTAVGPLILGHATNLVFDGVIGGMLPDGQSKSEAVAQLRANGQNTFADMVNSMDVTPGAGVDFGDVAQVLLFAVLLYAIASALSWVAAYLLNNVVVGTIQGLRAEVEHKIHRLPLR